MIGFSGFQKQYGPARYEPLLPGISGCFHAVSINLESVDSLEDLPIVRYSIHADNAPVKERILDWEKVHMITKKRKEVIDPLAPRGIL